MMLLSNQTQEILLRRMMVNEQIQQIIWDSHQKMVIAVRKFCDEVQAADAKLEEQLFAHGMIIDTDGDLMRN